MVWFCAHLQAYPGELGTVDRHHISRQSELHCPLLPAASTHCSTLPDGKRGAKRACNAWCLSPPRIDKKDKPHAKITVGFGKAKACLKNLYFFNSLPWAKARNWLEMLRLALSCGGVWLLTFEGGIQCMHAPPDKIHVLEQLGEFRNNLSAPERLDPLISSCSIDLRPWPSTCTGPGAGNALSLMPNRLCMHL